jgi:hypothetical protein
MTGLLITSVASPGSFGSPSSSLLSSLPSLSPTASSADGKMPWAASHHQIIRSISMHWQIQISFALGFPLVSPPAITYDLFLTESNDNSWCHIPPL